MLRLYSKITFTPKNETLSSTSTGTDLINVLSKPLTATREEVVFDFVNNVEVKSTFEDLTSTATITVPRKLTFNGTPIANGTSAIFKRGDKVKIELGYFPDLRTIYEGYVSTVSLTTPLVIECEDEMFTLKKKKILWPLRYGTITKGKRGKTLKNAKIIPTKIKLKDLLKDVLLENTGIDFKCLTDVEINVKRFDSSVAEVLSELKKEYGLYSYFVDKVLHVGLAADASTTETIEFDFETHVIEDDLKYQRVEDVLLQVEAESINSKTNAREHVTVGDDDGQHKKFFIQNATKAELTKFAQSKLYEEKYEGFRGSFTTFGEAYVRHGDAVKLTSRKYPEKNGTYQVKGVQRKFGVTEGYKQNIEIGQKLS